MYIKISKYLSTKSYQENKERLQKKKLVKVIKIFLKKKKKKFAKISQKIKTINWLSTEKNIIESEKTVYYNYSIENFASL